MKSSKFTPFAITNKTLFSEWPGKVAVLVILEKGTTKTKSMEFENAQAALAWCEENRATFVYLPVLDRPERN